MKNYKVTLHLMVDPLEGDKTFKKSYKVTAENENKAYEEACKKQDNDEDDIKYRTIFNYRVILL